MPSPPPGTTITLDSGTLTFSDGTTLPLEHDDAQHWIQACAPGTRLRVRDDRVTYSLVYEARRQHTSAYWIAVAYAGKRALRRHIGAHSAVRLAKLREVAGQLAEAVVSATAETRRDEKVVLRQREIDTLLAGVPRSAVLAVLSQLPESTPGDQATRDAAARVLRAVLEAPNRSEP
jgi:hypothetical protein